MRDRVWRCSMIRCSEKPALWKNGYFGTTRGMRRYKKAIINALLALHCYSKSLQAFMRKLLQLLIIFSIIPPCMGQDSLRGSITAERGWWDVIKYDITVQPDIDNKSIAGANNITFKALADGKRM